MPSKGGRRRTNLESKAFKAEIIRLRGKQRSIVQIGKQLQVSRQYVSSVLINAGLGGRGEMRAKEEVEKGDEQQSISCLEQQEEDT
jgi:hypothetical protein